MDDELIIYANMGELQVSCDAGTRWLPSIDIDGLEYWIDNIEMKNACASEYFTCTCGLPAFNVAIGTPILTDRLYMCIWCKGECKEHGDLYMTQYRHLPKLVREGVLKVLKEIKSLKLKEKG